ncbi:MAG: hypothetical protein ACP5O4_03205 [bacterium]
MKKNIMLFLIASIMILVVGLLITSCGSWDNKFIGYYYGFGGNSGNSGSSRGNINGAVFIIGGSLSSHNYSNYLYNWYNGVLFDGNNYYISGWQQDSTDSTRKYTVIKLNPDLTLNYAKYYTTDNNDIGLTNICFNPFDNNKLLIAGWNKNVINNGVLANNQINKGLLKPNPPGLIFSLDKITGNLNIIKSYLDTGPIYIFNDPSNNRYLYLVGHYGHIIKLNLSNFSYIAKKVSNYSFENIFVNNDYVATYNNDSVNNNYGVVVAKKDLSQALIFYVNGNIHQVPLLDNNDNIYLIDKSTNGNLVISKINLNNFNNPNRISSKEYNLTYTLNNSLISTSSTFLIDGNIVIGISNSSNINPDIHFLKINKDNLGIINEIRLSPKDSLGAGVTPQGNLGSMTMCLTPDGGFFASRFSYYSFSEGDVSYDLRLGYALKISNNFILDPNNCVFNVTNNQSNIIGDYNGNLNYVYITNSMNNDSLFEDQNFTFSPQNVNTTVGCINSVPNIMKNKK